MKLDKCDKIILTKLEYNSRIREKELARLCHLSKDAIRYRIKKLEQQGVIEGYSTFLDYTKIGCFSYKVYLKIQGSEKDWQNLRAFLDSNPSVFIRFESHSDWNFALVYFAKNPYDFYLFERDLFAKFGHIIQTSELCHMLDAKVFETRILLEKKEDSFDLFGEIKNIELDQLDTQLLEILLKDSSLPLLHLSNKIKLSPDATKKRLERLERSQLIRRYTTSINYQKLGFEIYKVFIWVKDYTEEVEKKLISKLSSYNNARNIIRMIGPWKIEAEFICKNYDELYNLLKELRIDFSENITSLNYSIFRNEIYYPSKKVLNPLYKEI